MTETTQLEHVVALAAAAWTVYRTEPRDEFESYLEMMSAEAASRIGISLAGLRKKAGLTQRQLASEIGVPPARISYLESGMPMGMSALEDQARAVGVICRKLGVHVSGDDDE